MTTTAEGTEAADDDDNTVSWGIDVGEATRAFRWRRNSVGDRGVVRQMFEQQDYDLSRLAMGASFDRYRLDVRRAGKRPLIIDAGANIGASAVFFLDRYADAAVVAIEPEKSNCDLLRLNCEGLDVAVVEAAVGSRPGVDQFLHDPGQSDWGFRVSTEEGLYKVQTVSIPDILRTYSSSEYAPAIVKIDIEGSEEDLFARDVGWLESIPLVIIELHDWLLPGKATSRNFLRAISSFDFDFVYVGENVFCFNNALLPSFAPDR